MTIEQAVSEHLDQVLGAAEGPADPLSDRYALELARAENARLRAALAGFSTCQTIYQGYPVGFTCLDKQADASKRPAHYMPDYRARLVAGEELCEHCRARALLESLR